MTVKDVQKWERTKEMAEECHVKITIRSTFELTDSKGLCLGCFHEVDSLYFFLCGYMYSVKPEYSGYTYPIKSASV